MRKVTTLLTIAFIFFIPWENNVIFENLGTMARLAGVILTGFWLATIIATGKVRQLHPFHMFAGVFVTWVALSLAWSINTEATIGRLETYIQLFVLSILVWDSLSTKDAIQFGLQAYVFGAYVSAISTIRTFFTGAAVADFGRFAPINFDANDIGLIMSLGLIIAWQLALSWQQNSFILSVINYAYIPAGIFAIFLTGSRTAAVSILLFLVFVLLTQFKLNIWVRITVFLFLFYATLSAISFVPEASFDRIAETRDSIVDRDLNGRVAIWKAGFKIIEDNPILGIGAGAFQSANTFNKVAHNIFISVTAELGLVGLIPYLGMIFSAFISIRKLKPRDRVFWSIIFFTWLLGALTLSWEYRKITWLMLSLMVTAGYVLRDVAFEPDMKIDFIRQKIGPATSLRSTSN